MNFAHLFTCFLSLLPAIQAQRQAISKPQRVSVGYFRFTIYDSRLSLEEAITNYTKLVPSLKYLYYDVSDFYLLHVLDPTSPADTQSELENITEIAQYYLSDEYYNYQRILLNASEQAMNASGKAINASYEQSTEDDYYHGEFSSFYLEAVTNMIHQTYYYIYGAYIGVGMHSPCANRINQVLSDKDEWAKMGSNAANTLMALLPTFLAFGNLYVPRSSEAYTTSALVGLTTAFYSFGLPTRSISAVKPLNVHVLSAFGITTLAFIAKLGERNSGTMQNDKNTEQKGTAKYTNITREELSRWSRDHGDDEVKAHFVKIRKLADAWRKRAHWWHVPAAAIAATQVTIFVLAVYPLFQYLGVPQSIICSESFDWTGLYLGVSAGVNTVFRYVRWEMSKHERAKVYSVSNSAKGKLMQIIRTTGEGETTASYLPPLQPPYVLALQNLSLRLLCWRSPSVASKDAPSLLSLLKKAFKSLYRRTAYIFKGLNLLRVLRAGFFGNHGSARRWRPVFILVHLSTQARNPFITLLTGFIEAGLLLVLTFFFAAQWGGNLVITMVALALLLLFVTLGRALGLFYVWLSSQAWGLTIINCDNVDEIRGVLRIVCSMEGVLVCVNGATYFDGYRMDRRDGFGQFLDDYERGKYDEVDDDSRGDSIVDVMAEARTSV